MVQYLVPVSSKQITILWKTYLFSQQEENV